MIRPRNQMARTQITITLTEDQLARVDGMLERFNKRDRATVVKELFDIFIDVYEEAEEARLTILKKAREDKSRPHLTLSAQRQKKS